MDVNNDGLLDFVGVGNNYAAEVETVRYDGGVGVVLLGDGKGGFKSLDNLTSGFFSNNDDKDILKLGSSVVVASNNSKLKRFIIE